MKRRPVRSSVIAALGYDQATNTLEVEFVSGKVYRYFMIPAETYDALLTADSLGREFNENVRDRYPSEELHPEP